MTEVWKEIEGFEGKYRVSNTGKIFSLKYCKELKPKINNSGYAGVQLEHGDRTHSCKLVHRLVAEAFIENPKAYPIINHKDENPLNNDVSNLEWCDNSYNVRYSLERHFLTDGTKTKRAGKRTGYKVLQLMPNGTIIKEWANSRTIQLETGMSDWSISECCRGKRKTAYGFRWRYKDAI